MAEKDLDQQIIEAQAEAYQAIRNSELAQAQLQKANQKVQELEAKRQST